MLERQVRIRGMRKSGLQASSKAIVLSYLVVLITVTFLPGVALDNSKTVRSMLLSLLNLILLFIIWSKRGTRTWLPEIYVFTVIAISLLIAVINSSVNLETQLFGTQNRAFGLISLISLLILALLFSNWLEYPGELLVQSLVLIGIIVGAYAWIQIAGLDPWKVDGSTGYISSSLDNPNFLSTMLSITIIATAYTTYKWFSSFAKLKFFAQFRAFLLALALFFELALFIRINSSQGMVYLIFAISFLVFIRISNPQIRNLYLLVFLAFSVFVSFGLLLAKGPYKFAYQETLGIRVEYWLTGLRAITSSPLLGRGADSYTSAYLQFRSENSLTIPGEYVYSDSAHNFFIDIGVSYGIMACAFVFSVFAFIWCVSLFRLIRREYSKAQEVLFLVWTVLQIQSMINPFNLAVHLWNFLLLGFFISLNHTRSFKSKILSKINRLNSNKSSNLPFITLTASVLLLFLINLMNFAGQVDLRSSLEAQNSNLLKDSIDRFPRSAWEQNLVAVILRDNARFEEAEELLRTSLSLDPTDYFTWRLLSELPQIEDSEKREISKKLDQLNPLASRK